MTDKKTLKQNYLDAGSRAGVYIVRNLASKRALVALDRIKPTNDPGFDVESELQVLVALWRQEIPCQGEQGYGDAKVVSPTPACPSPTPQ